jgi:type II secretory ATPase GspE/PulE/Tfp pilus assembly ATPase PilB-like protein
MGIEPFLIASTVRAVIGQRLVRRLNKDAAEKYDPPAEEMKQIEKAFGLGGKADWQRVMKLVNQAQQAFDMDQTSEPVFWRAKESKESDLSYKGRMGIYEVLPNTLDIQKLIMSNTTSEQIQTRAVEEGMVTMQLDGLIKALCGMTTIAEILRVTRE